jgi:hypothetical protein
MGWPLVLLQGTIKRGLSDVHRTRNGTGRFSTLDERPSVINLGSSKRRPSPRANPALFGRLDPGLRPFDD